MIKSIKIENFQSHKDSKLIFDKGVNIIVGKSDSGKSAIIRAFKLVHYNRPGGDEYRSNWGGDTIITEETNEGTVIRTKTNSLNSYELSTIKEPFKAFGTDVPEEIKRALNMEDVNLQQQMDTPFLLSETSGNVAAHFNKIAKLDRIDKGLQYVNKEIKSITQAIKFEKKEIAEKRQLLEGFVDLERLEDDLIIIENLEETKFKLNTDIKALTNTLFDYNLVLNKIRISKKKLECEESIDVILSLYEKRKELKDNLKRLKDESIKFYYLGIEIEKGENLIKSESSINSLLKLYENKQETKQDLIKLSNVYQSTVKVIQSKENAENELIILEKEFHENFPDICPLCETKIKK